MCLQRVCTAINYTGTHSHRAENVRKPNERVLYVHFCRPFRILLYILQMADTDCDARTQKRDFRAVIRARYYKCSISAHGNSSMFFAILYMVALRTDADSTQAVECRTISFTRAREPFVRVYYKNVRGDVAAQWMPMKTPDNRTPFHNLYDGVNWWVGFRHKASSACKRFPRKISQHLCCSTVYTALHKMWQRFMWCRITGSRDQRKSQVKEAIASRWIKYLCNQSCRYLIIAAHHTHDMQKPHNV